MTAVEVSQETRDSVRAAVANLVEAEELDLFEDEDLDDLWRSNYRTTTALQKATRDVLLSFLAPGLVACLKPNTEGADRQQLQYWITGQQVVAAFCPSDTIRVATEAGIVTVTVLEPMATALARGGAYRVLCQTGPRAGQQCVLKHGGRPCELAQLHSCGVSMANWYQVVRERELHLHLGSNHGEAIPEMLAHGFLAAPLPPHFSALEGADAVLLYPVGEELRQLPLSPCEVLNAAADILGALIELIDQGAFHNEVHPRHVLRQPLPQRGRRKYMLIDYGGAACPRLADPAIEAKLSPPNQDVAPMLEVRPSVQDLLCGSWQSLLGWRGVLLSQGSDLQSLVFTLVLLAGGRLPWDAAAEAGDLDAACELRLQLMKQSGDANCLQCLPQPLRQFAAWVLRTASSPAVDIKEVQDWHSALLEAIGLATARQETDIGTADARDPLILKP